MFAVTRIIYELQVYVLVGEFLFYELLEKSGKVIDWGREDGLTVLKNKRRTQIEKKTSKLHFENPS